MKREVMCFDVATGKLLWQSAVPKTDGSPEENPEVPDQCGMAAATVATDGRRVYAIFSNGDLAAFNFEADVTQGPEFLSLPKEFCDLAPKRILRCISVRFRVKPVTL